MHTEELAARQKVVDLCKRLNQEGFFPNTAGNISVRIPSPSYGTDRLGSPSILPDNISDRPSSQTAFLITPSSVAYSRLEPEMLARMTDDGNWQGTHQPSSEWRLHLEILKAKPEINAIVHTHSIYATALSMTRQGIPACHYLIAALGGNSVQCAPYACFGSSRLSQYAVSALEHRFACLLSNHGAIAVGENLDQAVNHAVQLEVLAEQYYHANLTGKVVMLTDEEVTETRQAMEALYQQCAAKSTKV